MKIISRKKGPLINRDHLTAYLFLAPWLIGILFFTLWPFITSFIMSLQETNLFSTKFVGLDNYRALLSDRRFIKSLKVTIKFVVISVPLKLSFALFIAMLLKDKIKGVNFFRSALYLPSLIGTSVAVAAMWTQLFGPSGLINDILGIFGIQGKSWIANPKTALYVLVILVVWQFGSSMVIFLSGLKNIPVSLYEAAEIDGANKIQSFFYVTLPMLSPIILFNLILQTIGSFQTFTQAYIITKGGPINETLFMVLYIYNKAFTASEMGYASALSWVLLFVILIVTGLIYWTSKYWVYYES
ncbi:MAG: sugar ABC transporter permease [Halanaerobiaceae bacterium]|nr:sugar ABC transporter permease [Halanaerobiaceae bacterium]